MQYPRQTGLVGSAAEKIRLAESDFTIAQDANVERSIRSLRRPRIRVEAEPVLRAELLVNAVENAVEFVHSVRLEYGAAGRIRNRLESVLSCRVTRAF